MSIDDWYKNTEDAGWDAPSRDWGDDDRPDRGVDNWLDQVSAQHRQPLGQSQPPRAPQPALAKQPPRGPATKKPAATRRQPPGARTGTKPTGRASRSDINAVVRQELTTQPNMGITALRDALRKKGGSFAAIQLADIQAALEAINPERERRLSIASKARTIIGGQRTYKKFARIRKASPKRPEAFATTGASRTLSKYRRYSKAAVGPVSPRRTFVRLYSPQATNRIAGRHGIRDFY
ncbi:hypothetical protein Ahu01nite_052560 [Winogradskya humida]|uniref:Uncharacterized protein n=1 Tax=Winogradskya humida TaxID=113566 RepID=A0ABQ3ZUC8_9ACTN|nr:hypothetical protein Ahu01nite_052560 [Actinoplanes humidus]